MLNSSWVQMPNGYLNKTPIFQFLLLSCLFPLWAAAAALNEILITQFKSVFELTHFASALVQSAFYGGYFLIAIPASLVIRRTTYKTAILIGLGLYIVGCLLFFPASTMGTYVMFLVALFAIATGLSFLETAANTYSSMMGPEKYASLRLNISQTFYPMGAVLGILLGKYLIFQEGEALGTVLAGMSAEESLHFRLESLQHTLEPYRFLIMVLMFMFAMFLLTRFPTCKSESGESQGERKPSLAETLRYLAGNTRYKRGVLAQFLYMGMQVGVWSYTIRLALDLNTINERTASNFMIYSFIFFFIGRALANVLMVRFEPAKVLFAYSILGAGVLAYVSSVPDMTAVYAAVGVSILFGPCWATIYAQSLATVESKYTEISGGIVMMAIVGAAVVPALQGYVSDLLGSMQQSFFVSMLCFVYIGYYFLCDIKVNNRDDGLCSEMS